MLLADAGTSGVSQAGSPVVTSARIEFAFRLLNAMSFTSSLLAVVSALLVLISIANKMAYEFSTYCLAYFFIFLAITTALGGALTGTLAFLSLSGGIAIVGIVFIGLVICCAVAHCGLYFRTESRIDEQRALEMAGPPDFSVLESTA